MNTVDGVTGKKFPVMCKKLLGYYFTLQYRRLARRFQAIGLNPIIGITLGFTAFTGITYLLFLRSVYANYIFTGIGLFTLFTISHQEHRRIFQERVLPTNACNRIRLLEHFLISIPFLSVLAWQREWILLLALCLATMALSGTRSRPIFNGVIPSPFLGYAFENNIGFRKTILGYAVVLLFMFQAWWVNNGDLLFFALIFIHLLSVTHYFQPEPPAYVWIYKRTPHQFLLDKALGATIIVTALALPIIISQVVFFGVPFWLPLVIHFVGICLLITLILAKYSAFPSEISLPQALMFGLGFSFPPALIFIIPVFYKKAIQQLNLLRL